MAGTDTLEKNSLHPTPFLTEKANERKKKQQLR
jgi:hypothetical protein